MPQGLSLHIGLNSVDASKYNGWPGTLNACENDAKSMQAIAVAQGFSPTQLLTASATSDAILEAIGQAAHCLTTGDTFLISYSGHGGRVPDASGDSPDGMDDTWVAYDRMVLGHELYNCWSQFQTGVRIEVYSDSCHSGTVIRDLVLSGTFAPPPTRAPAGVRRGWPVSDRSADAFRTVYMAAPTRADKGVPSYAPGAGPTLAVRTTPRMIPALLALQLYNQNRRLYESRQWATVRAEPTATVILISGCQDNQTSLDGEVNGLFTEKLLAVWNSGAFQGTLPQFHQAILALMPPEQTPNYFSLGPDDPDFTAARPLSIVGAGAAGAGTGTGAGSGAGTGTQPATPVAPSVTGPATASRDAAPPSFTVDLGSNPYYIFEITSDPSLFGNWTQRTSSTFYATWNDPSVAARFTDTTFTLSQAAWDAIDGNDTLYYRVGSTSSAEPDQWNDYQVSVTDGDASTNAPSMSVTGAPRGTPRAALVGALKMTR